ncbi:MAG: FAD/NAD(P)-binding protein [Telluria sp.]
MKRSSVTIIGMGPRGLSILERIVAFARTTPHPLLVNLVDPNECGPGVHSPRQPQHLLTNTLASQVTIFPFSEAVEIPCACATPSLTEWAREQGYRRFGDQFVRLDPGCSGGEDITDADYLPRQLLGIYLAWACQQVVAAAPASLTISHVRQRAVDVAQQPGGYIVELENGYSLASDFVFLSTGHSRNNLTDEEAWYRKFAQDHARYNTRLAFVRHAYPLDKLVGIPGDAVVAIQGIGLTAHDVVAELTTGRGGQFVTEDGELHYFRSGQEPKLLLFSRNCMPALARGTNQKGLAGRHQARFLTRDAVAELREQRLRAGLGGQLDFDRDLLPLVYKEMGYAWRTVAEGAPPDAGWYAVGEDEKEAIDDMLFPLRERSFATPAEFDAFLRACMEADLREAGRGNLGSPIKAAADVLRDARAVLQDIVEHGGLAPASHREFLSVYNPAINRVTFGPPRQRNAQLLALIDAGVLAVAAGPNAAVRIDEDRSQFALHTRFGSDTVTQYADVLVVARLDVYSPETDDSLLTRNLVKRGLVRPYFNGSFHPGGIDIDYANHPLGRSGRAAASLWAVGYLVEGAHYYTHALPRPRMHSRQVLDAERCVRELFGQLATRHAPAPAPAKAVARHASGLVLQRS